MIRYKKALSAILSAAMVMTSLCVPVMAEESTEIEVAAEEVAVEETADADEEISEEVLGVEAEAVAEEAAEELVEESVSEDLIEEAEVDATVSISEAAGYEEGAYAKWAPVDGATSYKAYVSNSSSSKGTAIDNMLIRKYAAYYRVDTVGLAKGTYYITVEAYKDSTLLATAKTDALTVSNYDRSGFTFTKANSVMTGLFSTLGNYDIAKTGSGAYKPDGTLKDGAQVIYVTAENAKTVTATIHTSSKATSTITGLVDIIGAKQKADASQDILDIRIIGRIDRADLGTDTELKAKSTGWSTEEGIQIKGAKSYQNMNMTIEGIGEDASVKNFGFLLRNAGNVEMRNFAILHCMDDGVSIDTDNCYLWIHDMDFFYGSTGGDSDQAKGDGTTDIKVNSCYTTFSYNHYWDSGKTSLCGMGADKGPNYISYHHNWFDHSDSRHPRIRHMSVHIYNNYFDGCSKYGVGAAETSRAFVESNYFRNVKYPMMSSMQGTDILGGKGTFSSEDGGIIKAYNNAMLGNPSAPSFTFIPYNCARYMYQGRLIDYTGDSTVEFDAYVVENRSDKVPETVVAKQGGTKYDNFDTLYDLGVKESDITPVLSVPEVVKAKAGRLNGGDLKWNFDDATEDANYGVISGLKDAVVNYTATVVAIGGENPTNCKTVGKESSLVYVDKPANNNTTTGVVLDSAVDDPTIPKVETTNYKFVALDFVNNVLKITTQKDKAAVNIPDATKAGDSDFCVLNKCTVPGNTSDVSAIGLSATTGNIVITALGKGRLTFSGRSAGDEKKSYVCLKDSKGNVVADKNGAKTITVTGKSAQGTTYIIPEAGTYTLGYDTSDSTLTNDQFRVFSITMSVETVKGDEVPVTSVTVAPATLSLAAGETGALKATVLPDNASNKGVSWITTDNDVAIVDANGVVTGVGAGTATIKAVSKSTSTVFGSCAVTVTGGTSGPIRVTGISLDKTSLSLKPGEKSTLVATVKPSNAENKNVKFTSEDTKVVTVDAKTGEVTAVAEGTTKIVVIPEDKPTLKAECAVAVSKDGTVVPPPINPDDPDDPTDPTDPVDEDVMNNAVEAEKHLGNKAEASAAFDSAKGDADTVALSIGFAKGKITTLTPAADNGKFTVAAGSKIILPGINPANKDQALEITCFDETVSGNKLKFTSKNAKAALKIAKGIVTTKAVKDAATKQQLGEYKFTVKYTVADKPYSYEVTVQNLGFNKKDKKAIIVSANEVDKRSTTVDLKGLGCDKNDTKNTIWTVNSDLGKDGKNAVLKPGVAVKVGSEKKGYYATATLSADGKSVTIKTTEEMVKGKFAKGNVTIQAYSGNAKVMKTAVAVKDK